MLNEIEDLRRLINESHENDIRREEISAQREAQSKAFNLMEKTLSGIQRRLDQVVGILKTLGLRGIHEEGEIPQYEPVEEYDEARWEEYIPPEFIDNEGG